MSLQTISATLARAPRRPAGRDKPLRALAAGISRAAVAEAQLIPVYEALSATFALIFEQDAAGWVNIDPVDGRILIPVAWGRSGHQLYGLTRLERDTLRSLLAELRPCPVRYDARRRCWVINLVRCPDLDTALAWLGRRPLTSGLWRGRQRELSARSQARRG